MANSPLRGKNLVWSICRIEERMQGSNVYLKALPSATNFPLADNFNNIIAQQTALHFDVARSVT